MKITLLGYKKISGGKKNLGILPRLQGNVRMTFINESFQILFRPAKTRKERDMGESDMQNIALNARNTVECKPMMTY